MPLRSYKPTSPGRRFMTRSTFEEITTDKPHKPLLEPKKRGSGRNSQGRMTVRHRGGGEKRHYRRIDFKRDKWDVPARSRRSSTTPTARRASACSTTATARSATSSCPTASGRRHRRRRPERPRRASATRCRCRTSRSARSIHNIELVPGKGGQIVRSAGTSAQLLAKEGDYAQVRLPSGEVRRVDMRCMATVGQVGNLDHENQSIGKAGRARHMGQRPEVRGVVMNPRDHPHGGGEGKSPTGMPPKTPWGQPAMGHRTRRNKTTGRLIVRSRHRK